MDRSEYQATVFWLARTGVDVVPEAIITDDDEEREAYEALREVAENLDAMSREELMALADEWYEAAEGGGQ